MSLNGGGSREYNVQWAQQVSTDSDLLSSYIQCFVLTQLNVISFCSSGLFCIEKKMSIEK